MKALHLIGLAMVIGMLLVPVHASSPPSPIGQAILDQNIMKPMNRSSGTSWEEYQKYCAPHRNYDFKTKKWSQVPAIPFNTCVGNFKRYVDAKKLIVTPSFRAALIQAGI